MVKRGACLACRLRKVKCVRGSADRCERCVEQGFQDCVYQAVKKRGTGKTLRMGEACNHCRSRKKKCDAGRPCTACVATDSGPNCTYEVTGSHNPPSSPRFLHWKGPNPSNPMDATAQERHAVGDVAQLVAILTPGVTSSPLEPIPVPPEHALIHSSFGRNCPSPRPSEPRPQILTAVGTRGPTIPSFSVLSTLIFPGIPPEPRLTLSSLGAEQFQLSDVIIHELDTKFRLKVACRLGKLGIRFTSDKQQALLRGDTSGTVIHPFFTPAAHSLGMHLCDGLSSSPEMVALQVRYVQKSLELLMEIMRGHDMELRAQVALWVIMGSIVMRLSDVTTTYSKRASEAVNMGGLQFVPSFGRPPPLSDSVHEKLAVLSQIIYFENFVFLTRGGEHPTMNARIEKEFRHKLQETYPVLFKICPLTMRTQGILLVRDTVVILNIRPTETQAARFEFWKRSCDHLMTDLNNYSQYLFSTFGKFRDLGDKSGSGVIRNCCIDCFAHLAVLCESLWRVGPARSELRTLCDSALERLGELTKDMRTEEYSHLDLLLGVSWKKALEIFDIRIVNTTHEQSARLRHWRGIVAEVYSDFIAKLPDTEPLILTARARELDGRTEGSQYPNLMLPWAQQRYGL